MWIFGLLALAVWAAEPVPIDDFFRIPRYSGLQLSPNGRNLAALAPVKGRRNLVVIDLDKHAATPVTAFEERDVAWFVWLNDKRLLLGTGSFETRVFDARGGGIYAVDRDGADPRLIAEGSDERNTSGVRLVGRGMAFVRRFPGQSDDFVGQEFVADATHHAAGGLYRIDSRSGRRTDIGFGKPDTGEGESWVVDNKGVARAFTSRSKGMVRIFYRAGQGAPWQKLDEFRAVDGGWQAIAMADDDRQLVVSMHHGRDTSAIALYDPATRKFGEVLAAHPRVDLDEVRRTRDGRVAGVYYDDDRGGSAWFDERLARMQKAMDAALPNTVNRLSWSDDMQRFLVAAYSDVVPGSFYLFDAGSKKLEWIADGRPWLKSADLSPMRAVHYAARDGLDMPAFLTVPKGSSGKSLPMVVIVHGGPWVDGSRWNYDPEAQFLASRGYAVLEPNFRGSTGYGWKHLRSSYKQWGLAMQDDVTDGVRWAVKEGIADPKRVCIYGGSYGGYATMMGLAKDPGLYRCGINYVGVTDLPLFLTASWADYAYSDWIEYGVKDMVGDVDRDAERLKATSPVNLAERIEAPVLMAYGSEDVRVPIEHGTRMRAALDRAGVKNQWIVGEGEGHGFRDPKNRRMFYAAMEKFLGENLKPR